MVVSSSVVIALAEIGLASIMALLATEITVPHAVYEEVVVRARLSFSLPATGRLWRRCTTR